MPKMGGDHVGHQALVYRPQLANAPFDTSSLEGLLAADLFHILKSRVGSDIAGGVLIILQKGFFDADGLAPRLEHRLDRAESLSPGLQSFTKMF